MVARMQQHHTASSQSRCKGPACVK
jgi:hypothetical protein